MKLKLFNKYFFTTASIIIFSLALMMIILSFVLNNYIPKSKESTLSIACTEIDEYISTISENESKIPKTEFFSILNSVSSVAESDVFIADNKGKIIACGCAEPQDGTKCIHKLVTLPMGEINRDLNSDVTLHLSTLNIYNSPHYICLKALINSDEQQYGTVIAAAPVSRVSNLLSTVTKLFLVSALIPLLLMFLFIFTMTYRLTKPLKLMSQASLAMAKGDFSKRIPVMSDDEIGELSAAFNMMTNSLSQLEGMRKSFVANVSHELKTPMTTISGFIDGILDGTIEPEKHSYYLNIVSNEVKRLSRLVESMLSMAKLESGEFKLKPELFDFGELICGIVLSQEQRIEKCNIEILGLDALPNLSVNADRDLIHQVIYNLVDNAIKFTPDKGKISFGLTKENKNLIFTIKNSGVGIPENDLPHIFERFYKVDKSRSSSKNSTGLGLYIVKTIITSHSGTITVASKEDEYTAFKITLPIS